MKTIKQSFLVTLLLIGAFLCGKYFAESRTQEIQQEETPRVMIEQLKTKMNITKNREDIEIYLNGAKMTEDVKIDVKK